MSIHNAAVKEGSFLHHYMKYMEGLETPYEYDFWCGLWLVSLAVGRRMVVARPQAPVYLNLYVVLAADAGTTRKSSAIRRAEGVLRASPYHERYELVTGGASPEGLVNAMHAFATTNRLGVGGQCAIAVSELVTFLGRETYTIGMPGLLTDLYDCPAYREVRRAGHTDALKDVYVSFLSASTPAWLIRAINPDVIEGGFTSRCLFVIAEKRKRMVAWPEDSDDTAALSVLVEKLRELDADIERWKDRNITLSAEAKRRFVAWYEGRKDRDEFDPFITSFEAREDHHVLRLAGLLACNDRSFVISVNHLNHAIKIIAYHKDSASRMFGGGKQNYKMTIGIDKLRDALFEAGALGLEQARATLKVRHHLNSKEVNYALLIMHELEMVTRFEVPTKGRPKTVWRATKNIMLKDLRQTALEQLLVQ